MEGDHHGYGIDVARQRADDLDRKIFEYIRFHPDCSVLDIGCGSGGQSTRLAAAGAYVTGLDVVDYETDFARHRREYNLSDKSLHFVHADCRSVGSLFCDRTFEIISLQRVLHYLPYEEARNVLLTLRKIATGQLYIGVSGVDTALGEGYIHADRLIEERFCMLSEQQVKQFLITEPVCLYRKFDVVKILEETGWDTRECWVSDFGNIKAVAA